MTSDTTDDTPQRCRFSCTAHHGVAIHTPACPIDETRDPCPPCYADLEKLPPWQSWFYKDDTATATPWLIDPVGRLASAVQIHRNGIPAVGTDLTVQVRITKVESDPPASVAYLLTNVQAVTLATLIVDGQPDPEDGSWRTTYEYATAWHTIRLYRGPSVFLDEDDVDQIDEFHPAQCGKLPPGAVCWFRHDPHRDWWPVAHGTYRLREAQYVDGGDEDGPNIVSGMDIQVWNEATGQWADWHGETRGSGPADMASDGDR